MDMVSIFYCFTGNHYFLEGKKLWFNGIHRR